MLLPSRVCLASGVCLQVDSELFLIPAFLLSSLKPLAVGWTALLSDPLLCNGSSASPLSLEGGREGRKKIRERGLRTSSNSVPSFQDPYSDVLAGTAISGLSVVPSMFVGRAKLHYWTSSFGREERVLGLETRVTRLQHHQAGGHYPTRKGWPSPTMEALLSH